MEIEFLGAASLVTGSMYLLKIGDSKILIDSGMFQGLNEERYNYLPLKFDPSEVDCLILTHSHLDHCGLIPMLVKRGFNGPIYSTIQTKEIAKIILLDSARLQEIKSKNYSPDPILYNLDDTNKALSQFVEIKNFDLIELSDSIKFKFIPAGHVLGASSVVFEIIGNTYVFSGDIGRTDQSIIKSFKDYNFKDISPTHIIMESLYGGIEHSDREAEKMQMFSIIKETFSRNGIVYIPVFSLHRAQEVLSILKVGVSKGYIPADLKVYLDSPMAANITTVYLANSGEFSDEFIGTTILKDTNPFYFDQVTLVNKAKKSQSISSNSKSIVLAGSGMADGGRIVRHIYQNIENKNNSFVFVGFQAEGTLGRKLTNGIDEILLEEKLLKVKAKIFNLRGFSAHADNQDLLTWINSFDLKNLKKIFLMHAEKDRIVEFGKNLDSLGIPWSAPVMYDKINIGEEADGAAKD